MQPMYGTITALAVVAIYYLWRAYFQLTLGRERTLRRRVAFMLWVTANQECLGPADADEEEASFEYALTHDLSVPGP